MAPRTINGIRVGDSFPHAGVPAHTGVALVVGNAPGWQDEYARAKSMFHGATSYMVNRSGAQMPGDYWVSLHPVELFMESAPMIKISDRPLEGVDISLPIDIAGGSSSLLAVLVALAMGHSQVITAGVHLTGPTYKRFQGKWKWWQKELRGRLKSVSPHGTFITDYFGGAHELR